MNMLILRRYIVFFAAALMLTACDRETTIPDGTYKADDGSGESLVVNKMVVTMTVNVGGKLKTHTGNMELVRGGYITVSGFTSVNHADFMPGRQWRWFGGHFTSVTWAGRPVNYHHK